MENQAEPQSVANKSNDNPALEGEYYSSKDMFELEKDRIKSSDKRTEIARLAIEANDAADKRQFDYHMLKPCLSGCLPKLSINRYLRTS